MKNKMVWHQLVMLVFAVVVVLYKWWSKNIALDIQILWWLLGYVLGFAAVFADRVVYVMLMREERLSERVVEALGDGNYLGALKKLLEERHDQKELVMRSALFLIVWEVLAVFVATSVENNFGRGLVLGMGCHLFFDLLADYLYDRTRFDLWFWQVKRNVSVMEKNIFVYLSLLGFGVLMFIL